MSKFEENRNRLDSLMERLKNEGMSAELELQFEDLCSETGVAILLGPNDSIQRSDETEVREYADAKDLWYYNDTFSNIDYKAFLKDDSLGNVELEYSVRNIQGKEIPVLRISYEKKWLFFNSLLDEEKKKHMDVKIKHMSLILGCRWYEARVELVRV
jgi:hypothetical protein